MDKKLLAVLTGEQPIYDTAAEMTEGELTEEILFALECFLVGRMTDGYVAYPLGLKGVVVGQGNSYEEALSDIKSAIRFHIETFGSEMLELEPPVLEAFIAETGVNV